MAHNRAGEPVVSVVIPARDAQDSLPATLRALDRQTLAAPFEVIVVDNGSLDATADVAARMGARVIKRRRGEGPGAARNEGAANARAPVLAFTDADCEPDGRWLSAGLAALESADIASGRIEPVRSPGPFDRSLSVVVATGLFESANLFVRRSAFTIAGGFPTGLEGPGAAPFGEDALFGWTAVRAGARSAFAEDAIVRHAVFQRSAAGYLGELRRLDLFPELVRRAPEVREAFLYRRLFLTRRTAAFDLAAAGVLACVVTRRPWGLAAAAPYLRLVDTDRRLLGRLPAVVRGFGDVVGAAALLAGSARSRCLVL